MTVLLSDRQAHAVAAVALRPRTDDAFLDAPGVIALLERLGMVERRPCGGLDVLWHPTAAGRAALRAWSGQDEP